MSALPRILAHGGVGSKVEDSDGAEAACVRAAAILRNGGADAALLAAIEAAVVLEDDPRFNAGTGSNCRLDGSVEQDALVATCDGRIGGVMCLQSTQNPVRVAHAVMDTPHVLLCGDGATKFARDHGFPEADVTTERSRKRLERARERLATGELRPPEHRWGEFHYRGTIGAVARAADGTFAAASSTGGTSIMLPGRVGDTAMVGAGMMVSRHAAIVATGDGEEIIRNLCAARLHQRLLEGMPAEQAAALGVSEIPSPWVVGFLVVTESEHAIAATDGKMAAHALEVESPGH